MGLSRYHVYRKGDVVKLEIEWSICNEIKWMSQIYARKVMFLTTQNEEKIASAVLTVNHGRGRSRV